MRTISKQTVSVLATIATVITGHWCLSPSLAKPPGGGGTTALYKLVDLGGLPGAAWMQSEAVAVSEPDDTGHVFVVGTSLFHPGAITHPVAWSVNGDGTFTLTDLGLPPGATEAAASAVNDSGVIAVNTKQTNEFDDDGFLILPAWVLVPGMPLQQLPMAGSFAEATALDNSAVIVGQASFADGGTYGALWRLDENGVPGVPISLGGFRPNDINNAGVMAGEFTAQAAIAWFDGVGQLQVRQLGVLPGYGRSEAFAISEDGTRVAGSCNFDQQAFVWTAQTGMVSLGTLGGGTTALGVNNAGRVVGWSFTKGTFPQAAFLWQSGTMFDLNSLANTGNKPHLEWALGGNEAGHVVGFSRASRSVSDKHGFLLIRNR